MSDVWRRFVTGEGPVDEVDPTIYRSWQRCKALEVDYQRVGSNEILSKPRLRERCQAQEDLIQAGKPVLPYVFRLLKGLNYMVLLCDGEGYILEALGDPPFMTKAQQVYLSPGANWREDIKGTNAIGTSLAEKAPVKVRGWEHFVQENHFLSCWAAPLRNSRGDIVGVLDVSGEAANQKERLLEIVVMGARMIEQNLQLIELKRNFRFCKQGIRLAAEMLREGFIAIDGDGVITEINRAGAQLLGRRREEIIGRPASDVFCGNKNWKIDGGDLELEVEKKSGLRIRPRLREVTDDEGYTVGVVGVLQVNPADKKEAETPLWVGRSEITRKVFERAAKAAQTKSTVLIQGESGTGKEIVARYIHEASPWREGPFIGVNCAALPSTLIESELFGYADGAFTGAKRGGRPGKFELADGGTIFLDEIGDMALNAQAALLRLLQEAEVFRIGDTKARKINVRVIAATNKNLSDLVAEGLFRQDLYYRLKVITIDVPPLRYRKEDIWDLVPYFVRQTCQTLGKPPLGIAEEVYTYLFAYSWPGNVRELKNCIESMVAMADGPLLTVEDIPAEIKNAAGSEAGMQQSLLKRQTREAILQALAQTEGKIAPAARLLGIGRSTLYRKMKELGIKP
ncbi:sigma-54-dependent Fis family transcriptional regulator [Calderihabitans maritimus]|uniref:Transcriptional regulator n=1 Tax=Calderihabitans maritimus TaxID=1246530 RepID=A0A1Z5HVF7_9FIRM|nr:sigma-54-dependent Fis family transcriptional regulator [Calderihabitans maritimus]GAW93270.1 transcriptional regulator [Calderihabitans maritimus]